MEPSTRKQISNKSTIDTSKICNGDARLLAHSQNTSLQLSILSHKAPSAKIKWSIAIWTESPTLLWQRGFPIKSFTSKLQLVIKMAFNSPNNLRKANWIWLSFYPPQNATPKTKFHRITSALKQKTAWMSSKLEPWISASSRTNSMVPNKLSHWISRLVVKRTGSFTWKTPTTGKHKKFTLTPNKQTRTPTQKPQAKGGNGPTYWSCSWQSILLGCAFTSTCRQAGMAPIWKFIDHYVQIYAFI